MSFSTNNDFSSRELSTNELDSISAGMRITFPFHPAPGLPVFPLPGVPTHNQGGDTGRPHPGVPPYQAF
jgi:hypothetical protein